MNLKTNKRVILFQVKNNREKISYLYKAAKKQFTQNRRLLILSPNEKASLFADNTLWSFPPYSFLPHQISTTPTEEIICITHLHENLNNAQICFNLTQNAVLEDYWPLVYDFEDGTSEDKKNLSKKKLHAYKEAGFAIASF